MAVIAPAQPKIRLNVAACSGQNREANAHLIAAAPDLYDVVVELLGPLERASAAMVAEGLVADQNVEAAFDRAHAALRKARGEA